MDSFQAIRGYLNVIRVRVCRREAGRALLLLLAAIALILLVGPLWAGAQPAERVRAIQRAVILGTAAAVVAALAVGVILPRRRTRDRLEIARVVGAAAPHLASDLMSSVQLERELAGSPRFSPELAMALAATTAERLLFVDPDRVVPRRRVGRAAAWIGIAGAAYAAAALVLPVTLRAGWQRLLHPPALDTRIVEASATAGPLVGDIKLVLTYPAYTGRPPLTVPASSGDILAPRGTDVALETTALKPAAKARIVLDTASQKGTAIPMTVEGRLLRASLKVDRPAQYRFLLAPAVGTPLVEAEPHRVEIEPDRAPRVELIAPAEELDVSSQRRVELAYSIDDDYGISSITLVWRGPDGKDQRRSLTPPRPGARTAQAKFLWDLSEIALAPGTRVAYHLEARDNDDVGGPNVGTSRSFYLKVFSPRQRHEELVERQQAVFEAAVRSLGDRLETPAEDLERRHDVHTGTQRLVAELGALLTLIGQDTLAPKGLKQEVEGIHARLDKLIREEHPLLADLWKKQEHTPAFMMPRGGPVADIDKKTVLELEKDVLLMDDWLARQRMEELLAISDELKQHRARLKDLMQKYERTRSAEVRAEIEREIRAIEQRIAELQAKASMLSTEVADRFMNSDAMQAQSAEDCFAKVRELMDQGDVKAAEAQLERCERIGEAMADALEQGLHGLRNERFTEEEKAYSELLGEVADLEREQRQVAGQAEQLMDRYKQRAAQAARDKNNPMKQQARRTLEKLQKEVDKVPREGLTPFSQEELDALKQRLSDTGKMLDEGDVAEALAMARHAREGLRNMAADIEDDVSDGQPWSDRTAEAQDEVGKAQPLAKKLIDELEQATPSPQEMMSPEDRQRMQELMRRQQKLQELVQKLAQKAQRRSKDLPGTTGEVTQKGLEQAGEQMGRAAERAGVPDPMGARDEAQGAADKLSDLQKKMGKSARPSSVGNNGRDPDEEPVKIPGSEEYKPPEEFREDILDAMKKAKAPDAYKDQVKRYYQELVK
jgi:uncharacterized protein DUF4175